MKKNRSASYLTLFHDSLCRKRIFYFKIFRTFWNCSYQLLPVSCISFLQVTNAHHSYVFLYLFIDRRSSFLNKIISLDSAALRKLLNVKIIDDEEYEKNKTFTIVLEEPILLEVGQKHGKWHSSSTAIGLIYLFNCFTNYFCLQTCVCVCVCPLQETLTTTRPQWGQRTCRRWDAPPWASTPSWRWSSRSPMNSR